MTIYSDFGFSLNQTITKDIETLEDSDSINQSIRNILFTRRGEVAFDPLFGSGISDLLFEKMSAITEMLIRTEIQYALANHEPRIEINNIDIEHDDSTLTYTIDIEYIVLKLGTTANVELTLQLQGL